MPSLKFLPAFCALAVPFSTFAQAPAAAVREPSPASKDPLIKTDSTVQNSALLVPPPPTRVQLKPIQFSEYDLPNGLHVILHQNRAIPVVSTYVLYHVGAKNERPDRTGFAHFFEHLMFEGTANIPRGTVDKLISGAGGNLNASTSFDQTDYFFNVPSNQLKLALWIESDRMLQAVIDETGVETQRKVVKEEKRMRYDNQPYGSLFEQLAKLVFAGTPYAWVPIGSVQYIDQAKIEEFRDFYKTYYLPNNATLAIAGDFDVETVKQLVADYFGPIPRGPEVKRPEVTVAAQTAPVMQEVKEDKTPLNATLHAWRAVPETHPDAYAIEMLGSVLSSGRSSRLYKRLVEKEQAALNCDAFPFLLEKAGMLGVFATGQQGASLEQLDTLIDEEVEKVQAEGVTEEEYRKVLNQQEAEFANSSGTMSTRARNLARYHVFYGDANLINTELDRYFAVKREDLQRVARQYLTKESVFVLRYPTPGKAPAPAAAPAAK